MTVPFSDILGVIVGVTILLFFVNYAWFVRYLETIYRALRYIAHGIAQLGYLLLLILRATLKTAVVGGTMIGIVVLFLSTLPAAIFGSVIQSLSNWTQKFQNTSKSTQASKIRDSFVQIVAEYDEREPRFESEEEYRKKIVEVPESTKSKLENGELVLSLSVASILIILQHQGIPIDSIDFAGGSVTLLIDEYLVILAISVLYRISIIDWLSYDRSADFDNPEMWDAAYGYQRAVTFTTAASVLMLFFIVTLTVVKAPFRMVEEVLVAQREEDLTTKETIEYLWDLLTDDDD
ncbi:hypothetical protein [Halorubrum sp. GN11GM_10-3_MGM]|uniref:hypothetical protein n=1 Tax=Halorubrum sp. GN11GM_10-3_MGM TaxID=2518111 RepID=UPI0010F9C263|nr:hypothetical protein [Halorubrum sp. GN11GM_10-3_MGM]TKX72180.1 hypothetical protein EXE40_04880 [Halorubrum sp. GN11GM_10-3_MGM]